MDLFVLDTSLNQVSILDTYKSLIWTERYNEYGDFEIVSPVTTDILTNLKQDYYLERRDTDRTMIIEKILIKTDIEDGNTLTITGRSLESILLRRIVWGQRTIKGNLQNGIKELLDENVISPTKPERKISNFVFQPSTDPNITSLEIDAQYTGDVLYDVINGLCSERGIGFKVIRNEQNQFVFSLYSGTDRSYNQVTNPYVVFSPGFENIINSNYMESKSALKNVTLVGGEGEGSARRYTAVGNISGLERRELFTDARDLSSDMDEDLTIYADFTDYPSQVFSNNSKTFVTNNLFNSTIIDISPYIGRTLSVKIPKYTTTTGSVSGYATILVDEDGNYVSTLQEWESYGETENRGSLETYEFLIPNNAKYLYTSMFSQKAINDEVYYGELDDFECKTVKLSNDEYTALLRQRGKEKLAENIDITSFEGEVEATTMFVYGVDFFIGDIVQIANEYGHETTARIIELVTSDDESGSSVYPTFSTIVQEEGEDDNA